MAFTMLSDGTGVMRPKTRRLADLAGSLTRPGQPKVAVENMSPFKAADATRSASQGAFNALLESTDVEFEHPPTVEEARYV